MKPYIPILVVLMLVSASFIAVSYRVEKLSTELIIEGPKQGVVGELLEYTFSLNDSEGNFSFIVDWGDGNKTGWLGPYPSSEKISISYVWYRSGNYTIKANARDQNGSYYSATFKVRIIDNKLPGKPKITGSVRVQPGTHEYTFKTIDPDGDNVCYQITWGDDTGELTGWYASGEEVTKNHTYPYATSKVIKARAKDIHGAIGDWGSLRIIIPKDKQIFNLPFLQFLMSIVQFPLLSRLLGWILW